MAIHFDEFCDGGGGLCMFCETGRNCALCCPEHMDLCPDCGRDFTYEDPCEACHCGRDQQPRCGCDCHECPNHGEGASDYLERQAERRQMGIT